METLTNTIQIHYVDKEINKFIEKAGTNGCNFKRCFSYKEEFFLNLNEEFIVPHFPIHHDVRKTIPGQNYLKSIKELFTTLFTLCPELFSGLIYFFNPGILSPCACIKVTIPSSFALIIAAISPSRSVTFIPGIMCSTSSALTAPSAVISVHLSCSPHALIFFISFFKEGPAPKTITALPFIPGDPPDLSEIGKDACPFYPRCKFATDECRSSFPEKTNIHEKEIYCHHPLNRS